MVRRVCLFSAVACLGLGCGDAAQSPGRVVLERAAPRPGALGGAPAQARYCWSDSILSIVAVGDRFTAALALRTPWPAGTGFAVDSSLGGAGTAAIAVRVADDSLGPAFQARRGSVDLERGARLRGRFSAEAGSDSSRRAYSGRFEGLEIDTTICAVP